MYICSIYIYIISSYYTFYTYNNLAKLAVVVDTMLTLPVADLGGVPRVPWNPPFGFSCDRKLWKPGLQQNPTIQTVTTNKTILIQHDITV